MATFVVVSLGYLTGYLIVAYGLQRRFLAIAIGALVVQRRHQPGAGADLRLHGRGLAHARHRDPRHVPVDVDRLSAAWGSCAGGRRTSAASWWPSAATWLGAWGLNQAGAPTLVWVAAGGALYAALVIALGAVRLEELRNLTRRGERMTLLHVAVDANVLEASWGGIPKHVYRVVSELAAGGDRVDLLVNLQRWESPVPGARATPLRLRGRGLWRDLALPVWAARHKPDVLWAPETVLPRRIGVPTVVTVHDLAPLLFPGSKPPSVERAFRTSVPRSVRSADARDLRLRDDGPRRREALGRPACDGDRQRRRRRASRPATRRPSGAGPRRSWASRARSCCTSARWSRARASDVLIAAAAAQPGWRLVLAGRPGHEGERIAADAREAGAILLPDVDDAALARLYRAAEVVAVPSLYEGFGMVPLEAMASGTPAVVAADAGALAEVAGDAAIQVAERTPEAWTRGIEEATRRREELILTGAGTRGAAPLAAGGRRRPRGAQRSGGRRVIAKKGVICARFFDHTRAG